MMWTLITFFVLLSFSQILVNSELEQTKKISIPLPKDQLQTFNSEDLLDSVLRVFKNGIEVQILNPSIEDNSLKFDLGFKRKSVQSGRNGENDEERDEERKEKEDQDADIDDSDEQIDKDTNIGVSHSQGFNTGFLPLGDSFEMMGPVLNFPPAVPPKPVLTCAQLMSKVKVQGAGCVTGGCCSGNQQTNQPGVCSGNKVCCFSNDTCRREITTQAPSISTVQPTPAGPVDARAPRDNCSGQIVQGSSSIGCIANGCCAEHRQVARYCPGSDVCCFSSDTCVTSVECSQRSKQLACRILERENDGLISIAMNHTSGYTDFAYPRLNLQQACNKMKSQRSSNNCPDLCEDSPAPGGSTCLSPKMLQYIESLIISKLNGIYITAITGGCHHCGSKHYDGLAVELKRQGDFQRFLSTCRSMGGKGLYSTDHIYCEFFE